MYDPVTELEHYGVLGMKWGVRRTPAQLGHRQEKKLNRYKKKEIKKVNKRIAKIDKEWKKYDEQVKKTRTLNFEKVEKFDFDKNTGIKEIEAIKKMSYKDMQDEKIELGKRFTEWQSETSIFANYKTIEIDDNRYTLHPEDWTAASVKRIKTARRLKRGRYAKN